MATFSEFIHDETPVLVDFYAGLQGPCKTIAPILEELKSMVGKQVRIIKVDVDTYPLVGQKYHILSVPTLMLFREGKVLWRKSGVAEADKLYQWIHPYMPQLSERIS
jgi:thioredoxin 1